MNVIFIKKKRFNLKLPSVFDATLAPGNVAIFDGDVTCRAADWTDVGGTNVITNFNAPTYDGAGLNGHGTILFDGINQFGNSTTPVLDHSYTIYLVLKQITWNNSKVIIDDGVTSDINRIDQLNNTPEIKTLISPGSNVSNQLFINTWNILSVLYDFSNSGFRIGLNPLINVNGSDGNQRRGITLAVNFPFPINFSNTEFAYIIMRNVADPTWLQNNFINWLKNRFAI